MLADHTIVVSVGKRCPGRDLGSGLADQSDCGCGRCGPGLDCGREDRGFYPTTPATCCFSFQKASALSQTLGWEECKLTHQAA